MDRSGRIIYSRKYAERDMERIQSESEKGSRREQILMELSVLPDFDKILTRQGTVEDISVPGKSESAETFIHNAKRISEKHEIDIEIVETRLGYRVDMSFDYGVVCDDMKCLFTQCDSLSFSPCAYERDITFSLEYYVRRRKPGG